MKNIGSTVFILFSISTLGLAIGMAVLPNVESLIYVIMGYYEN